MQAIAVYADLLARFGAANEPALRALVAMGLFNKGARLGTLKRREEAIAAYDEVLARFGTAAEPMLRELVERTSARRQFLKKS